MEGEYPIDPDWDAAEELLARGVSDGVVTVEQLIDCGNSFKNHARMMLISICEERGCSEEKLANGLREIDESDAWSWAVKKACFALRRGL